METIVCLFLGHKSGLGSIIAELGIVRKAALICKPGRTQGCPSVSPLKVDFKDFEN